MDMKYLIAVFAIPCCMLLLYSVEANHTFGLTSDQLIRKPDSQVGFSEQGQLAHRFSLSAKQVFWLLIILFQSWS